MYSLLLIYVLRLRALCIQALSYVFVITYLCIAEFDVVKQQKIRIGLLMMYDLFISDRLECALLRI